MFLFLTVTITTNTLFSVIGDQSGGNQSNQDAANVLLSLS